jgi:hypothetical protein
MPLIRMITSRRIRLAWHVARMENRNVYRILVGKSKVEIPPRMRRHKFVDNIKIDLIKIELGRMDWIELAQVRDQCRALVNIVVNLWVP